MNKYKIKDTFLYEEKFSLDQEESYQNLRLENNRLKADYDINKKYKIEDKVHQVILNAEKEFLRLQDMEQRVRKRQAQEDSILKNNSMKLSAAVFEKYKNEEGEFDESQLGHSAFEQRVNKIKRKAKEEEGDFLRTSKHVTHPFTRNVEAGKHPKECGQDEEDEYKYFYSKDDLNKLKSASNHCKACLVKYSAFLKKKEKVDWRTNYEVNKGLIKIKSLMNNKKFEEANVFLEDFLKKGVDHTDMYYLYGEIKRIKGAEEYLLKALSFEVFSPFVFYSLGLCYLELNHISKAEPLLKRYLDYNENDQIYYQLARCALKNKDYVEAVSLLSRAIEINNNEYLYFLQRGDAYENLKLAELARQDYLTFKALKPDFESSYIDYIQNLESRELWEESNFARQTLKKLKAFE